MINTSKSLLLMGVAAMSLSSCAGDKGPGQIGSKDDIVVINKGMPGAQTAIAPEGDFSSSVEQAQAVPAPAVEPAQNLAAVPEQESVPAQNAQVAAEQQDQQQANIEVAPPMVAQESVQPQADIVSEPSAPVAEQVVQPVVQEQTQSAVWPSPAQAPAPTAAQSSQAATTSSVTTPPAQQPANAPSPEATKAVPYPLDANAPYSPKAMAAAAAAAGTPVTEAVVSPSGLNLSDPALIRSVQAALAAKSIYVGPQTGIMNADLLNAVTKYQADMKLPVTGGLNEETLKSLGIIK